MQSARTLLSAIIAVLLIPGGFAAGFQMAQDEDAPTHPVAIHAGTCDDFDTDPVYDIGTISPDFGDTGGMVPGEDQAALTGFPGAVPVATGSETLGATFDDVFTEDPPHSVVVHTGSEPGEDALVCGELGGVEDDGRIMVALYPVEDSGLAGIGIFDEDDAGFLGLGDDEVNVTIYLMTLEPAPDVDAATPVAGEVEEGLDGFANDDWLVDSGWIDERVNPESDEIDGLVDLAIIGVFSRDDPPSEAVINTAILDPAQVVPVETTDDVVEGWREELLIQTTGLGPGFEDGELDADHTVVFYDDGSFGAAAGWWAFDYLGHEDKRLLDGGLQVWSEESEFADQGMPGGIGGQPVDHENVPDALSDGLNEDVLATMNDVEGILEDPDVVLVDARSPDEYAAGHLPGAVNIPASENVESEENPVWSDPETLQELYAEAGVTSESRVVAYGGEGFEGYATYFTLGLLGYEDVAVYPGGWVEWSQYPALPRGTGE